MEEKFRNLPLRNGVGIVLINKHNKVFVAKRIDNPKNFWQMPQGGVDEDEDLLTAAYRELKEETNLTPSKMFIADHVSSFYEKHGDRINFVPVFGIEVDSMDVTLSDEHCEYKWVELDEALSYLVWEGQKKGIKTVHDMVFSGDGRMKWSQIDFS